MYGYFFVVVVSALIWRYNINKNYAMKGVLR